MRPAHRHEFLFSPFLCSPFSLFRKTVECWPNFKFFFSTICLHFYCYSTNFFALTQRKIKRKQDVQVDNGELNVLWFKCSSQYSIKTRWRLDVPICPKIIPQDCKTNQSVRNKYEKKKEKYFFLTMMEEKRGLIKKEFREWKICSSRKHYFACVIPSCFLPNSLRNFIQNRENQTKGCEEFSKTVHQ
jgi:hypothetical protein